MVRDAFGHVTSCEVMNVTSSARHYFKQLDIEELATLHVVGCRVVDKEIYILLLRRL